MSTVSMETVASNSEVEKIASCQMSSVATTTTIAATTYSTPTKKTTRNTLSCSKSALMKWYYDYWMPFVMVCLALLGLFGALGHHLYNASLDGKQVTDSQWPSRLGIAISYFVKLVLIASVQIAYKQQAWVSVKKRGFKVSTLDAIFSVEHDPFQFANHEFLLKAKIPTALAVISWVLPLCAIATPSTLTSQGGIHTIQTNCSNIPSLNLTRENIYTLEYGEEVGRTTMAYWGFRDDGGYYYTDPSMEMNRLFKLTALSHTGPIQPPSPCPLGTDCSYTLRVDAPVYSCEKRAEFGGQQPLYNASQMVPQGKLVYASYSSYSEGTDGQPLAWQNMSSSDPELGVFTQLPSLWLGWATNSTLSSQPPENSTSNVEAHIAECIMYNATHDFNLSFSSGEMTVNQRNTTLYGALLPTGHTKAPGSDKYLQFGGYHAAGYLLRNLLSGNVTLDDDDFSVITYSDITMTNLLDPVTQLPASKNNFPDAVAELFQDLFISMVTDDILLSKVNLTNVPCSVTAAVQIWRYERFWLVLSYALAVSITTAVIGVGLEGFYRNGYTADANFSTFIATSRSRDLDDVGFSSLGRWPKSRKIMETRLKFGEVISKAEEGRQVSLGPRTSFGFPDNVAALDKRKKYV